MKNNKGITLVSLVVTILVLAVISSVTINVSLDTYNMMKAQNFIAGMKVIQGKVDNFAEEHIDVDDFGFTKLSEIASSHKEDYDLFTQIIYEPSDYNIDTSNSWNTTIDGEIENYYYFTPEALDEKLGIKNQEMTVIVNFKTRNVITKDFVKENDVKYYRQYDLAGGEKLQQDQTRIVLSELNVGDYVTYSPSGSYTWQAKYASSDLADDGSADVALATGSSVAEGAQDMSISSWRVFSIDEKSGKVELVPTSPTNLKVRLQGAQGYNNAVKLLNDACSSLYGNSSKGINARSINIEDIESRMTPTALAEAHSYVISGGVKYGEQTLNEFTGRYPIIYRKENMSVINGVKNTTGLGLSEQNTLIGRTDEGAELGNLEASTSMQPYQTYWYKSPSFFETAFQDDLYSILVPQENKTYYWVASRCIGSGMENCAFRINNINAGVLFANNMYGSNDANLSVSFGLFPIVSLNARLIKGNDTDGWFVE